MCFSKMVYFKNRYKGNKANFGILKYVFCGSFVKMSEVF